MASIEHKPEMIIIAGPNGSGKTSITQKFLHHEWAEGTILYRLSNGILAKQYSTDIPDWAITLLAE